MAGNTTKDGFHDLRQFSINSVPRRDFMVEGDWKAHTGPSDELTCYMLGRFGLGRRCQYEFRHEQVSCLCFQHFRSLLYGTGTTVTLVIRVTLFMSDLARLRQWKTTVFQSAITGNMNGADHVLVTPRLGSQFVRASKDAITKFIKYCYPRNAEKTRGAVGDDRDTVGHRYQYQKGRSLGRKSMEDARSVDKRSRLE